MRSSPTSILLSGADFDLSKRYFTAVHTVRNIVNVDRLLGHLKSSDVNLVPPPFSDFSVTQNFQPIFYWMDSFSFLTKTYFLNAYIINVFFLIGFR